MKVLEQISVYDVIGQHFGYDDYQGRWWETYRGRPDDTLQVVANPSPLGNGTFDWLTYGLLIDDEEDDE